MLNKKALAGTAGAPKLYVEDVFSTYLYTGTGSTQTITNNIDLSTEGGLVWTKNRDTAGTNHILCDTGRGITNYINSNNTNGQNANGSLTDVLTATTSTGYSLGADATLSAVNVNAKTYVSWTFRKAKKFFDVVTYTGNGTARTISHNLGSTPGCIIVKRTDATAGWPVYHRSIGATKALELQITNAAFDSSSYWNNTEPTSTVFTVGTDSYVNANGGTYVAYLFAHDAGGFGDAGSDNVISCGSFTTNGSGAATVTLGYEPQWVLLKSSTTTTQWIMLDTMRGWTNPANNARLFANLSNAETSGDSQAFPTATGFGTTLNASQTFIYIAIRRGPMKTPTTGTSVFNTVARTGSSSNSTNQIGVTNGGDLFITKARSTTYAWQFLDCLRGYSKNLDSSSSGSESTDSPANFVRTTSVDYTVTGSTIVNNSGQTHVDYLLRRAPGFFDVVCYTGTGSATTFSHNLGVVPEMMIVKRRSGVDDWAVYHSALGNTKYLWLNSTNAEATSQFYWNNTTPTTSVFTLGTQGRVNDSGGTYVAYLFASVSGVSKVGSFNNAGSDFDVNCGFTNGARFVLVKRYSSTGGGWFVFDSARGIVAGNDPLLGLNSTAAEDTSGDYIDTYSQGFRFNGSALSTGDYIFLAIA